MNQLATLQDYDVQELKPSFHNSDIIEKFLNSHNAAASSRALYKRTLAQFQKWLEANELALHRLLREHLIKYRDYLIDQKLNALTINSYLTSVRRLFAWLESERISPNIARDLKGPKRSYNGFRKDPLTQEQSKKMLDAFDTTSLTGLRDFAIVNLLLRCGLRTIEVARADICDLGQKHGKPVLFIQGKGETSKDQCVILSPKVYTAINDYLYARGPYTNEEPLFPSYSKNNYGGRISTRAISQIAKDGILRIVDKNEAAKLTAHSLRHSAGVNFMKSTKDLYATQLFMRHSKPETTQIYLKTIEEELRFKSSSELIMDELF